MILHNNERQFPLSLICVCALPRIQKLIQPMVSYLPVGQELLEQQLWQLKKQSERERLAIR